MPKIVFLAALIILLGIAVRAADPGPLERFSPADRARLEAGEAVFSHQKSEDSGGTAQAAIIVARPASVCFTIFSDLERQSEYFPKKTKSKIVKTADNQAWLENEFDFYVATVYYTSQYTIHPDQLLFSFELDPAYPHNINASAGSFQFEAITAERTLFTYTASRLDTGVAVPAFAQQYITSKDLPAQAVNVRKRIESGGAWKDE